MKYENKMKVSFTGISNNESFARVCVASFISALDPTVSEISDIKTAVSEAVTNCIVHAYADSIGIIYITVLIKKDRELFFNLIWIRITNSIATKDIFIFHYLNRAKFSCPVIYLTENISVDILQCICIKLCL